MAEQFIESTLMDGYGGGPHITETQTGLANQGLYGQDDYVLSAGRKAEAQILTNNSIRIFDAVFVIQGRRDVIAANDYTDVSIDNGAQGMNRNDIIVRRYTKDESSEIENTEYAVIKGTPTSGEAEDPAVTIGDIRSGALEHEMKLYRVKLEGLNIVAVEPLFQVLMDMSTLNADLSELISNLTPSSDELIDGVTITRCGRHRVLQISNATSPTAGDIVRLPDGDIPPDYVMGSASYRGQTQGDYFISITSKSSPAPGKVGLFRGNNVATSVDGPYIVAHIDWYV